MYAGRLVEIGPVGDVIQSPLHPYTQGLMGSIPALDGESARLLQIRGAMPRLTAIPQGCAFHPRCPKVLSPCASQQPGLQTRGASQVACWLHADAPAAAPSAP
jgi:peptide/nickel transport system ATP-binding protein